MRAADFVSLAELLAPARTGDAGPVAAEPARVEPTIVAAEPAPPPEEIVDAIRDARLFRARLHDALHDARDALLAALAGDVLARELRLAPCDLDALIARRATDAPVVRVRVAPDDAARVRGLPVIADSALLPGNAVIETAGGALDARLGVRLAAVLDALR